MSGSADYVRSRLRGIPLTRRLPLSYAAVALLTMVVLGAILVPLLTSHYSRSEWSYLRASGTDAIEDLAGVDWGAIVEGRADAVQTETAARQLQAEALLLQVRIQVLAPDGRILMDSGQVSDIDAGSLVGDYDGGEVEGEHGDSDEPGEDDESHHLPNSGLFRGNGPGHVPRSDRVLQIELLEGDQAVGVLRVSEGPAYGTMVLRTTVLAWLVAGFAAVILAGLVGWFVSRRLTRPLLAITAASNRMAQGDLSVRADVERTDEIGSLALSFNAMAETTEQTVSTLRRFVADAAHEIGTPLTALQADLELAESQTDEAGRHRLIGRAMGQAERIGNLSAGLLRLSRLETKAGTFTMEALDLVALARSLGNAAASRAEQAGIVLAVEAPSMPMRVRGNAYALTGAIQNLLDNAIKFTPAGGSVTLGVDSGPRDALVWVEDTGIGIPAADMPGIFSRFHRARNASSYPGSGLGLAIVRATMQLHQGTVSAQSPAPGNAVGSRFELRLPVTLTE